MMKGIVFGFILLSVANAGGEECNSDHSCKLEALGCFNDKSQRAMPEEILNERDTTSKVYGGITIDWKNYHKFVQGFACRCAKIAARKGYSVIGLQFYGECWSGPEAHLTYNQYGTSAGCVDGQFRSYSSNKKCLQYIGRSWTNHVYRIGVSGCSNHNIEPIGCFADDLHPPRPVPNYIMNERDYTAKGWNKHLIDWKNWVTYSPQMICRCAEAAKQGGYNYFAIQFWGECWTGNDTTVNYNRNGMSTNCRNEGFDECKCNSYNCVGMAYTNYVYKLLPPKPCKA